MRQYLVQCTIEFERIDELIISAELPEQASSLWSKFFGYPWPCQMNLIPEAGSVARVDPWNRPIEFGGADGDTMMPSSLVSRSDPLARTKKIMVLNDGKTFADLAGCRIVAVPQEWSAEQIEAGLRDNPEGLEWRLPGDTGVRLWNVAWDAPYGCDDPDEHGRDAIYLLWLCDDDIARLRHEMNGKVSLWEAGIASIDGFIEEAREFQAEEPD